VALVVTDDEGVQSTSAATKATILVANTDDGGLVDDGGGGDGGACFIATAAYGSYLEPHVVTLRRSRDEVLMTTPLGGRLVALYYEYSPPLARRIQESESLRLLTRVSLTPLILAVERPFIALFSCCALAILAIGVFRRRNIRLSA
jgi:hypothetical protein